MIFLSFLFLVSRKVVHYVPCHEGERGERKGKKSVNKFHPSKLRHWFILFPSSYRQTVTVTVTVTVIVTVTVFRFVFWQKRLDNRRVIPLSDTTTLRSV